MIANRTRLSHTLRTAARGADCPQWQLALAIGIHPSRLSQWLRGWVVHHADRRVIDLGAKLGIPPGECFALSSDDHLATGPSVPDLRRYRRGPIFDDRPGGPFVEIDARIWEDPALRSLAPLDQAVAFWLVAGPPALSSTASVVVLADRLHVSPSDALAVLTRVLRSFDWSGISVLDTDGGQP